MPAGGNGWLGLGIDVLEVVRMRSLLRRHGKRLFRIFNPREMRWAAGKHKAVRLAEIFAAKEAVFKSLGINPVFFMRWREIEIVPRRSSHAVRLKNTLKKLISAGTEELRVVWEVRGSYVYAAAVRRKRCAGS